MKKFAILAVALLAILIGRYLYMKPSQTTGEAAKNFTFVNIQTTDSLSLNELEAKLVLIEFWGSWCGPCLKEIPQLKQLYGKYSKRGFEIVSIAVEENKSSWEKMMERQKFPWPYHIVDINTSLRLFDGKLTKLYGVRQLPTKYLLDGDGNIIAINPDFPKLEQLLEQKLKT